MIEKSGPIDQEPHYTFACECGYIGLECSLLSAAETDEAAHNKLAHDSASFHLPEFGVCANCLALYNDDRQKRVVSDLPGIGRMCFSHYHDHCAGLQAGGAHH